VSLIKDLSDTRLIYLGLEAKFDQMIHPWISPLAHHQGALFTTGTGGEGEVIGRRQLPLPFCIHQEAEVLCMVITVVCQDIEHCKAIHPYNFTKIPCQHEGKGKQVFILE